MLPIHKYPEYKRKCCELINSEWQRSETARMKSLDTSCDQLPISLILIDTETSDMLGHCKLAKIPNMPHACFMESVVIKITKRKCGYGSILIKLVEEYTRSQLNKSAIYLRTRDQIGFYSKLGYQVCEPISIFGNCNLIPMTNMTTLTYMLKNL